MLIGDKLVYIELHKTGSSHITKILSSLPSFKNKIYGKHNPFHTIPKSVLTDFNSKIKIGSIRNPWDWYVSIWAFGCLHRGALYYALTKTPKLSTVSGLIASVSQFKNRVQWKKVYANSFDPELFRQWLKYILIEKKNDIGEGYGTSDLSDFAGLLTYRYLKLFTYNFHVNLRDIVDYENLEDFDKKNNFIDMVIKTENLNESLIENASKMGIPTQEIIDILKHFNDRTNASERNDYRQYYDGETKELVKEKERFIIEKYNYNFDN